MIVDYKANFFGDKHWNELSSFLSQADQLILYHSTSNIFLDRILKEGIKPPSKTNISNYKGEECCGKSLESNPELVYLIDYGHIHFGANGALRKWGGELACFRILIDDLSKLRPDEDSRKDNYHDSLAYEDSCAYEGIITPEKIIGYYTINKEQKLEYKKLKPLPENIISLEKNNIQKIVLN
mgnify:CR=1 FL=1|jgi:hypothetical protein